MARTGQGGRRAQGRNESERWSDISRLAAANFRNQQLFTSEGQAGQVMDVYRGDDDRYYAAVDFGWDLGKHQVPIDRVAFEGDRFVLAGADETEVRSMPAFTEEHVGLRDVEPDTALDIHGYPADALASPARPQSSPAGYASEPSRILVEQAAPDVTVQREGFALRWQQAAPQVTVRQSSPRVAVRQPQPTITVRQPPPKITVELAEPEIIVRMPDPDVDITQDEPKIEVNVPRPHVQFSEPQEPTVDISSDEPQIRLMPRGETQIELQREQPQVSYEQMGEPQVTVQRAAGPPTIRFEESAAPQTYGVADTFASSRAAESRRERREGFDGTEGSADGSGGLLVSQIEGAEVYDSLGVKVGTVHRLIVGRGGNMFIVLDRRGFLSHKFVLLPIESFTMSSGQLVTPEMTDADMQRLDNWDERMDRFTAVAADKRIRIPVRL